MRREKEKGWLHPAALASPRPVTASHHAPLLHPHLSSSLPPSYPLHPFPCLAFSLAGCSLSVLVLWLVCVLSVCVFLLLAVLCWWCCFVLWLVFFVFLLSSRVLVSCVSFLCLCFLVPGFLVVCPVCVCVLSLWCVLFVVCLCSVVCYLCVC